MIFHPVAETRRLVELVLFAGARHQLVLDDILQEHAPSVGRHIVGKPRPDFGGCEIEIGLLDVEAVDARHDRIVGGGGKRQGKDDQGCEEQQRGPDCHGMVLILRPGACPLHGHPSGLGLLPRAAF